MNDLHSLVLLRKKLSSIHLQHSSDVHLHSFPAPQHLQSPPKKVRVLKLKKKKKKTKKKKRKEKKRKNGEGTSELFGPLELLQNEGNRFDICHYQILFKLADPC